MQGFVVCAVGLGAVLEDLTDGLVSRASYLKFVEGDVTGVSLVQNEEAAHLTNREGETA